MAAVVVALICNSTPVSFGAVGTPTILGIGTSLDSPNVIQTITGSGISYDVFLHNIGFWSALIHAIPAILLPLMVVMVMTRFFGEKRSFREGLAIWPYAIFAGLCFVVPYLLTAWLMGPEFPSLVGALIGLAVIIPLQGQVSWYPKRPGTLQKKISGRKVGWATFQQKQSHREKTFHY